MPDPILTLEIMRLLTLAELEKLYIRHVLKQTNGKGYGPGGAAERLGLSDSAFARRLVKHGVALKDFKS